MVLGFRAKSLYTYKHVKIVNKLLANSRFYILTSSLLLSIFTAAYLRNQIVSDQLYYIRLEQIFGFISLSFLYVAVLMTPLGKLVGKKPWMQRLLFARRGIGVSAAYFAILHVYFSLAKQVGGFSGLGLLPARFQVSFILGTIALVILFLMAATSMDKVIEIMTFRRWKRLHRFVYLAGVVVIIHVWLIGTHMENNTIKIVSSLLLGILFGLESRRVANSLAARFKFSAAKKNSLFAVLFVVLTASLFLLPLLTKNYHSQHQDHSSFVETAGLG